MDTPSASSQPSGRDFLWLHLRELPYFRALLRAVEARFYQGLHLPRPVLDIGCGDGHFASVTFDEPLDVGLDPDPRVLPLARGYGGYRWVLRGYGDALPFGRATFASAVSNSVLEHIPDVDNVLCEVARVLRPGAPFIFCVPNHRFAPSLSVARFLKRLGWCGLAGAYQRFFNRISRHYHCDDVPRWQERLERAGFALENYWHYFSPGALACLEWGHYFGLPSLVARKLTGKWILAPYPWNLALTRRVVQPYFDQPAECANGVYTFYIARRS